MSEKPEILLPATMHPERNEVTLHLPNDDSLWSLLEDISPVDEERQLEETRNRVRQKGASERVIEMLYGKPLTNEELERALEEARERARRNGWPEDEIEDRYGKPRGK
jgi:hypothetical protein